MVERETLLAGASSDGRNRPGRRCAGREGRARAAPAPPRSRPGAGPRWSPRLRAVRLELRRGSGDRRANCQAMKAAAPSGPDREQEGNPLPGSAVRRQRRGRFARRDDESRAEEGRNGAPSDGKGGSSSRSRRQQPQGISGPGAEQARERAADGKDEQHDQAGPDQIVGEPGGHDFSAFSSASISAMSASLSRSRSARWATSGVTRPPNMPVDQPPRFLGDIIGARDGGPIEVAAALFLMGEDALGEQAGEHRLDGADAPAALGRHPPGDLGRGQRRVLPEHLHHFMLGA